MTVQTPKDTLPDRTEVLPWGDIHPRVERALRSDGGMPERHPADPAFRVTALRWTGRGVVEGKDGLRFREAVLTLTYARAGEG
jgi:hypothetical protein